MFEGVSVYETNISRLFEELNDPYFSACYRFNSGRNSYGEVLDLLYSTTTGIVNGLTIAFNIKTPNDYDYTEMAVIIHNYSSPPNDMSGECMYLRTGSWNFFPIERVFTELLEEPYNDCLKGVKAFKGNKTIIDFWM